MICHLFELLAKEMGLHILGNSISNYSIKDSKIPQFCVIHLLPLYHNWIKLWVIRTTFDHMMLHHMMSMWYWNHPWRLVSSPFVSPSSKEKTFQPECLLKSMETLLIHITYYSLFFLFSKEDDFPGSHSSLYYSRSNILNCVVLMKSDALVLSVTIHSLNKHLPEILLIVFLQSSLELHLTYLQRFIKYKKGINTAETPILI